MSRSNSVSSQGMGHSFPQPSPHSRPVFNKQGTSGTSPAVFAGEKKPAFDKQMSTSSILGGPPPHVQEAMNRAISKSSIGGPITQEGMTRVMSNSSLAREEAPKPLLRFRRPDHSARTPSCRDGSPSPP